ncbi:MAG: 50S ribosomal protein L5 [Candidatus Roizmanbacteria bacterium GW2011_GWA2_36_23]|uniref:Large ribosomal subunit protein uL5 n=1 Tax=Candidatus Roizmanbacteria bacterium GW2011_GWA2_36_23 TaxID=1618480 RepID=A0A0G0EM20_9BACT|nr:MAG: 50S ribosomal protein L5 [Candidatus Roizmanbacteria bacterium GW2011_GWA2_36_23]
MSFQINYNQEIKAKLFDDLKLKNIMETPKMIKVVLNVGAGEAVESKNVIEKVQEQLSTIAGQKAVITKAKKSVSAFKIRKGLAIGVKVTLRGKRMYEFVEKLVKIVIPRIRDFRGIPNKNIDQHGNLNLGFPEQTIFPEIEYDKIDKLRGLEVTIVTNAKNKEKGKKLFELLGIPFKN